MIIPDVNVYIAAFRVDHPDHGQVRAWLLDRLSGGEPVGVWDESLAALARITTNLRVFQNAATPDEAIRFGEQILRAPTAVRISPDEPAWRQFADLVRTHRLRANDVPDARLAALALSRGATLATLDTGFGRFPGLRLLDPRVAV